MHAWLAPDALNTRIVFRVYAAVNGLAGIILLGWGPRWITADAALIRVFGAVLIAVACFAAGFAAVEGPPSRHRSLLWFAGGQTAVFLVLATQQEAVESLLGNWVISLLQCSVLVLYLLWYAAAGQYAEPPRSLTTVFHRDSPSTSERVRAAYEQQIRQTARQEERNRLARDLHDSIKQQVFVIQTAAATAQVRFDSDRAGASEALREIRQSAREAMAEMEVMLDQLRSSPLENTGLVEALKKQCEAIGFRTGARVEFEVGGLPPSTSLVPGTQEAILRAAQEALANVARHARAGHVRVSLEPFGDHVTLTVCDYGSGFDPNRARGGIGIQNMRQRAEELGGNFEINSRPGGGTSIRFSVPWAIGKADDYRTQAIVLAMFAAGHFILVAWTELPVLLIGGAFFTVAAARSGFAWLRLRKQHEAVR